MRYILAVCAALTILLSCCGGERLPTGCPDAMPAPTSQAWESEMVVGVGPGVWDAYGIAGATTMDQRPIVVRFSPYTVAKGGPYGRFVARHEFLHALGWMGHPYSGPDDKVVYMDEAVPENIGVAKPGDVVRMPEPSALEKWYVRAEQATIWIRADPEVEDLARDAAEYWNGIAGREIFRFRPSPTDK